MIHPTEESRLCEADRASRFVATAIFGLVPCLGAVALGALATFAFGVGDCACGLRRADDFAMVVAFGICPSTLNAIPFGITLSLLPPIAAHSARRLYVVAGALGIVAYAATVVLAIVTYQELNSGPEIFVLVPLLASGTVPILGLGPLIHVGWLARHVVGVCPQCGYDMAHCSSQCCPECGRPARPAPSRPADGDAVRRR